MRIEFHPEALLEFREAATFYQKQQRGLGGRFADSVELAIGHIRETPLSGREIEDGVRRQLTKVFPYAVLYSIEAEFILIVAVMHSHREPGYWRDRL